MHGKVDRSLASVAAIRRLLAFVKPGNGVYLLICVCDLSGTDSDAIHRQIIWDQPELLFPRGDCRGCREYVGLIERGPCRT